jgi:hypothetical protein
MLKTKQEIFLKENESVTKKEVIRELRRVYFKHFKDNKMTILKFRYHSKISFHFVIKHFDTWNNALNQAEIAEINHDEKHDEKAIIKELRRVYFKYFETLLSDKNK